MRWKPAYKACWTADPGQVTQLLDCGADPACIAGLEPDTSLTPKAPAHRVNKPAASQFSKDRTNTK